MSGSDAHVGGPVIGVAWPKDDYLSALRAAGAEVRLISPDTHPLSAVLEDIDGLLLTGGSDVGPERYGERERHPTVQCDTARDDYELPLARAALERNIPLLAICRGIQVLNVAAGGTLIQDIPTELANPLVHAIQPDAESTVHDVAVRPGTCLARLLGGSLDAQHRIVVNSRHHQAVKLVPKGLEVSATAPDGIVEAIEASHHRFCVAVQWHPENYWRTGEFASLFEGLVRAAAASASDRPPRPAHGG
jgi:putative glutamine amidotransferase